MNKLITIIASCLFLLTFMSSCNRTDEERSHILKVYNWADYIDEDVLAEFPAWYKEQTGEDIRIIYQVFDINEIMLTKIERGHEDFDLICPSEYIIERMLKKNLFVPIDRNFGKTPDYLDNVSPYIRGQLNKLSQPGRKTTDYVVPYMWGTAGILYNKQFVEEKEVESWECLWDSKFRNKILMKDSYRDSYGTAIIYAHAKELEDGTVTVRATDERQFSRSDRHSRRTSEKDETQHCRLGSRFRQGNDDERQSLAQFYLERRCGLGDG